MFAICYACDNNYALQVGASIRSLLNNNPKLKTHIFIFTDCISPDNKGKLLNVIEDSLTEITFINTNSIMMRIKDAGLVSNVDNSSLSTFVRLFIQEYIPIEYDKVLYLDADTIVVGNIIELIEHRLEKPIAAVVDIMPQRYKKIIGFRKEHYYNCGVLLINMELWRKKRCETIILDHIKQGYGQYLYADQDVINICFKNEIDKLPLKYNMFPFYGEMEYADLVNYIGDNNYYSKDEYTKAQANPSIIHLVYSVVDRPWFKGNMNNYSRQWNDYVSQTDWKKCKMKKRSPFSRTKLMQVVFSLFGNKVVIVLQKARNNAIFDKAEKQYRKDGIIL